MIDLSDVSYGKVERIVTDAHFYPGGTAFPTNMETLTATNGVISSLGANSQHYASLQVNTTGTTQLIGMRTNFDINIANYQMVRMDVYGFHFTTATMNPGLTISSTTKSNGVSVWSPSATPTQLTMRFFGDTGDVNVSQYTWASPEHTRRRNIGLMILPPTKEVFLLADDQVIYQTTRPGMVLGLSRFWLESNKPTNTASVDAIRLAKFKVTVQHN